MEPDSRGDLDGKSPIVVIVRPLPLPTLGRDHLGVIAQGTRDELTVSSLPVYQGAKHLLNKILPIFIKV